LETCRHWSLAILLLEKLPLFALVLAWSALAFVAQGHIKALPSLQAYPFEVRVWHALESYAVYLGKTLWPLHLAVYYPHPGAAVSVGWALAAGLLLAVLTALVLGPGRRRPYLAVGWLWYLGTLVPMIGLVQIGRQGMADRYTYVPLIGLFLMLTWGAADLATAWRLPRFYLAAVAGVVLAACAALAWSQLGTWKGDGELWEHALAVTEQNGMAHNGLGMHYFRQGRIDRAEKEFEKAVAADPEMPLFHHNLATLLREQGRGEQAAAECRKAVALNPQDPVPHLTLGNLLRDQGLGEEAVTEFHEVVRLDPDNGLAHGSLAIVLADLGRRDEALEEFRRASALDPQNGPAHLNLGMALQAQGRLEEAAAEYRRAAELRQPSALPQLRACERLRALRPRLDGLLARPDAPRDNAERLAFAELCGQPFEGRYALAARLYADAIRADPRLANDLGAGNRFDAAAAAARAGCGQGQDAAGLDDPEKARLRRQALDWLRADLSLLTEEAHSDTPQARAAVGQRLRAWQRHAGLAGVRDPAGLARLPEAEGRAWQELWRDVEAVRARAGP
jgi:Tfp pilus assembly protein PilF